MIIVILKQQWGRGGFCPQIKKEMNLLMEKKKWSFGNLIIKKIFFETIAILLGVLVALISPPETLSAGAMQAIGLLLWALINWITGVIPDYVTMLIMSCAWVILKIVPFEKAFVAFSGSTIWLIIAVLTISVGVSKCGLLKRIALAVMKIFPATFKGQVAALLGSGYVIAPLIPSTVAKASIAAPIARSIGETLGFEKQSRGMTGLFSAMYSGFGLSAPIFISASFFGYIVLGTLPDSLKKTFTWGHWLLCMIPYALVLIIGCYFSIIKMYKPKEQVTFEYDKVRRISKELGPMSWEEKLVMVILLVAIGFWITESITGIAAVIPALLVVALLIIAGIVTTKDLHCKVSWSMIIFIGGILSLADVLSSLGINAWVGDTISPYIAAYTSNPYLFIPIMAILMYLLRFIIVSMGAAISVFAVIMAPISVGAGYSAWVPAIVGYASVMVWNVKYQNSNFAAVFAAMGGEDVVSYQKTIKMSVAYMVVNMLALVASIPLWHMLGMVP